MRAVRRAVWIAVLLCLAGGCKGGREGAEPRKLLVAAASDLRFAFDELLEEFHRRHPDVRAEVSYGSSGNFFAQLSNRAPFDLYFSADVDYPRRLIADGLAPPGGEFVYALGHLVVWVPQDSLLDVEKHGTAALLDPSLKIAIANPKHAPYGRAARSVLQGLGVYERAEKEQRLVLGENVMQAAQFIQEGNAQVGVIALSLALAPKLRGQGRFFRIPQEAYPPLEQGGVILSWSQDKPAAEALRAFVLGEEGRAVLRRYGFGLPGE